MNARKRRLAKRRRAAVNVSIGRYRQARHYVRKGWRIIVDDIGGAYAKSEWGYTVRLW